MNKLRKTIVVSAVNIRKGGTLTILRDCLRYLSSLTEDYRVIALVHKQELCNYQGIEYIEMPNTIKGWSNGGNNNGQKFASTALPSGTTLTYLGTSAGSVETQTKLEITSQVSTTMYPVDRGFTVEIESSDWGKALGGMYSSTITFTTEVVVA